MGKWQNRSTTEGVKGVVKGGCEASIGDIRKYIHNRSTARGVKVVEG